MIQGNPIGKQGTELSKRVTTGVIGGVLLILLVIFGDQIGVSLLAAVISIAMIYEFCEMAFSLPDKTSKRNVLMGIAWLVAFINYWAPRMEYSLLLTVFLGLFIYFLYAADRHAGLSLQTHLQELAYSVFGCIYLIFFMLFLPLIRGYPYGAYWTILFLAVIWASDTGAYFIGKRYGKRKLYELISPKKTVEGALGGLASAVVVGIIYKILFFHAMSLGTAILLPLILGITSQIGDLSESLVKRAFGKKDSGSLLPGHGGVLDRFDGVVFSLPIMYGCIRLFGQ